MANNFKSLIITDEENEQRIKDGIEKNRKGNFTVQLDSKYAGKQIRVKLKNHNFRFGANLFMLDEFPDDKRKNEIYKEKFKEVFNLATLPFYWDANEPEEGKTRYHKDAEKMYRRPPIDLCIEYCKENNIEPREHGLCYDHFYPEWTRPEATDNLMRITERRMREISQRYAEDIPTIEVTNEILHPRRVRIKSILSQMPNYVEHCYALARKYFPNNILCINEAQDFVWQDKEEPDFFLMLKDLTEKGCSFDTIGAQFHMFKKYEQYFEQTRTYYNLANMFRCLDLYGSFEKPLEITEVTIPAYTTNTENEEEQADIVEKMYSVWFSHPNVEKIIYWNLVDGYAAGIDPGDMSGGENYYRGGLLRFDMSEKPAFKRLKRLIKEVWITDEILTVDENGRVSFRGFYGEYEVLVENENEKKSLFANFENNGQIIVL